MTIKKVQSGDKLKIPAAAYNSFVDAAEAHKANMFKQSPGKDQPGDNLVLVKNTTPYNKNTGDTLGIDGPLFGPDDNLNEFKYNLALKGVTPTKADHAGKFAVTAEPIAAGKIGRAYVAGICPARVYIGIVGLQYAEINIWGWLEAGYSGSVQILYAAGGTGMQWALVRLSASAALPTPTARYRIMMVDHVDPEDTNTPLVWQEGYLRFAGT